jgi:hypothetical protein
MSWPTLSSDDKRLCHDLFWGDIRIGTDDIGCCHDQIVSAMWMWKDVRRRIHYQFEVLCDLEMMIEYDVMN